MIALMPKTTLSSYFEKIKIKAIIRRKLNNGGITLKKIFNSLKITL
jgi:hypothetical protein